MVVGAFFLVNLFVGITIDRYDRLKEKADWKSLLNDDEHYQWFQIQKLVFGTKPKRRQPPPATWLRRCVFHLVGSGVFDKIILVSIVVNMVRGGDDSPVSLGGVVAPIRPSAQIERTHICRCTPS